SVHCRRGDLRVRPHGQLVGLRYFQAAARHVDLRQGAVGRLSAHLRRPHQREDAPGHAGAERQARQLRARLHTQRPSRGDGSRPRGAEDLRGNGHQRPCTASRSPHAGWPRKICRPSPRRRCRGCRPDRRHRARPGQADAGGLHPRRPRRQGRRSYWARAGAGAARHRRPHRLCAAVRDHGGGDRRDAGGPRPHARRRASRAHRVINLQQASAIRELARMIRVAFDIGGTFTDFVLSDDATGAMHTLKVPTSSANAGAAVIEGLEKLLAQAHMRGSAVDVILHATTVATNAVLERKGAKTGLVTTRGFRDVLIIGRQKRYETYDMYIDKPEPLVPRRHIVEVVERVAPDGSVVTALEPDSVDRAIDSLLKSGRETVAVSLLHAYANGEHERRIREQFARRAPHLPVSISSEVSPKFREYERTNTTVTNAYVKPVVDRYLRHLGEALAARGICNNLFVMQSNGGLISPDLARDFPVRIIESGPAAGVLMSAIVGKEEG